MSASEVESTFKLVTKAIRTVGVTISINRFSDKVYMAVDALLIDRTKDLILKSRRSLSELFSKHDSNKNGFLEPTEFENMLLECQVTLKPNLFSRLINILTPNKNSKLNLNSLKAYFQDDSSQSVLRESHAYDFEPSLERV